MTIDDTAPIHELDRLLDGFGGDDRGNRDAAWTPTLRRLSRLDDGLAPTEEVLRDVRCRVLVAARPITAPSSAPAIPASRNGAGIDAAAYVTGSRPRVGRRRANGPAAAAAVVLLAVGSVWLGRGSGGAPPPAAPSLAMADAVPMTRPAPSATETRFGAAAVGKPESVVGRAPAARDPGAIAVADVARASVGGFGSDDLVGLLAIGADAGQREYAATRDEMLRDVDASWTAFVEERRWRDLLGAPAPDPQALPWSPEEGAG